MELRPQIVAVSLDVGLHANTLPERCEYEELCQHPSRGVIHQAESRPAPIVSEAEPSRDLGAPERLVQVEEFQW